MLEDGMESWLLGWGRVDGTVRVGMGDEWCEVGCWWDLIICGCGSSGEIGKVLLYKVISIELGVLYVFIFRSENIQDGGD